MTTKDYTLYGTKIYDYNKKQIGLLINTWVNKFADANIDFATCVDPNISIAEPKLRSAMLVLI